MAWTVPLTALANATLTSAQWNATVRDNLLTTAPAQASAPTFGGIICSNGTNSVAQRSVATSAVGTSETTTSATYVDMATAGPTVTVFTGTNAICMWAAQMSQSTNGAFMACAPAVSGSSSVAAADSDGMLFQPSTAASAGVRMSTIVQFTGLTIGSNTFKIQYRASAGTGTFSNRRNSVIAL